MDGTPLLTISNILGHSSPKTTTGYTNVILYRDTHIEIKLRNGQIL